MINVLVSGASGIVGYGILRSLLKYKKKIRLIGTTIYDDSIAPAFCDYFEKAPLTTDKNYFKWLVNVINKYSIDIIIPGIENDMILWNANREKLLKVGVIPILNNSELIELCVDKWIFYKKLIENNYELAIPTNIKIDTEEFNEPIIIKPRRGFGSKGIIKVLNQSDFNEYKNKFSSDCIVQPIIGSDNEEYTVSGFFDCNSKLIDYFPLKRKLSTNGFTQSAEVVNYDFSKILIDLAKSFYPIGPTNFQFRFDSGAPKLIEINPRISSATSIRAKFGYNESYMSINYFLNKKIPRKISKDRFLNTKVIRYVEDFVFL